MNREEKEIIDRCYGRIAEDATPVDMLPYLPCLTQSDREIIKCEQTSSGPKQATYELLSRLRRRAGAFQELVDAFRLTGCGHLADLLDLGLQGMRHVDPSSRLSLFLKYLSMRSIKW